ncbi:MAG: hypothetical protein EOR51_19835 [Mesorhizobium sp.]|nr:MAG: hypothetical protein EOR51_19835 [Mesorhizobium sp.]
MTTPAAYFQSATQELCGERDDRRLLETASFAPSPFPEPMGEHRHQAAQWTGALKDHAFFAYAANYLTDQINDFV